MILMGGSGLSHGQTACEPARGDICFFFLKNMLCFMFYFRFFRWDNTVFGSTLVFFRLMNGFQVDTVSFAQLSWAKKGGLFCGKMSVASF
jgi:hypothetical protein